MPPGGQQRDLFQGDIQNVDPRTPIGRMARGMLGATVPAQAHLTSQEVQTAEEIQKDQTCRWCGGIHARACPRVKRLTYDNSGTHVTEVEFWAWGEWPVDQVVWPEDLVEKEPDVTADQGS